MDIVERLRAETAADHAAVEGSVPLMGPGLDMSRYVSVLRRMHGIVAEWEMIASKQAPAWLRPLVMERQRLGHLQDDLQFLHALPVPMERPELPRWTSEELAGPAYVMEGSRLGGLLIAKHLETQLHLAPGCGDSYFRSTGTAVRPRWDELLHALRANVEAAQAEGVIAAAKQMFSIFGNWMRETS